MPSPSNTNGPSDGDRGNRLTSASLPALANAIGIDSAHHDFSQVSLNPGATLTSGVRSLKVTPAFEREVRRWSSERTVGEGRLGRSIVHTPRAENISLSPEAAVVLALDLLRKDEPELSSLHPAIRKSDKAFYLLVAALLTQHEQSIVRREALAAIEELDPEVFLWTATEMVCNQFLPKIDKIYAFERIFQKDAEQCSKVIRELLKRQNISGAKHFAAELERLNQRLASENRGIIEHLEGSRAETIIKLRLERQSGSNSGAAHTIPHAIPPAPENPFVIIGPAMPVYDKAGAEALAMYFIELTWPLLGFRGKDEQKKAFESVLSFSGPLVTEMRKDNLSSAGLACAIASQDGWSPENDKVKLWLRKNFPELSGLFYHRGGRT